MKHLSEIKILNFMQGLKMLEESSISIQRYILYITQEIQ